MRLARFFLLLLAAAAVHAQSWDSSGNSMLNGTYYFRQVIFVPADEYGDLSEAVAVYGNINFHGDGTYAITTTSTNFASYADTSCQCVGNLPAMTGTYSIAASGYGFISSPYVTGDLVYGMVSKQGIFVASSTDNANSYSDMMIAAPLANPLPTASSFTGTWTCASMDLSSGTPTSSYGAIYSSLSLMFTMTPNGVSSLGTVSVSGYSGNTGATALPIQTYSGITYKFSNGAAVVSFPSNSLTDYIQNPKYFYFSPDGNFLFGGAPGDFDMIVGVKSSSTAPTVSGLYYQAGMDEVLTDYYPLDAYYGSFNVIAGSAPQTYIGHERLNNPAYSPTDYMYEDTFSPAATFTQTGYARWAAGDGGAVLISSGIGPYLGISVALQAPGPVLTTTGPYIYPTGVVNAASSAPFTASIVPGEDLTLYGQDLAPSSPAYVASATPFPSTLDSVSVTIGGLPAPVFFASAGQVSVVVPFGVTASTTCGCVQIQLSNNGTLSNTLTAYVGQTSPGVFTVPAGGIGIGAVEDAVTGALITTSNPATVGENLAIYLTGLGAVSPTISDGSAGSAYPNLSNAAATLSVDFSGTAAAAPSFAGLNPTYAGLYQMNVVVPTGVAAGTNFLGIAGPDSYMSYALIPVGSSTASGATAEVRTPTDAVPPRFRHPAVKPAIRVRRIQPGK